MTREEQINDAITNHLSVLYDLSSVADKFDVGVIQSIENIATYATNEVVDESADDLINHNSRKRALSLKYPFLTEAAKIKIADLAAYFWK